MTARELASAIDSQAPSWFLKTPWQRASWVILWCDHEKLRCNLNPEQLVAAMSRIPYWSQGPSNYLDFIIAYGATCQLQA